MRQGIIGTTLVLFVAALLLAPTSSFAQANPCGIPMEKKPAAGEKKAEKSKKDEKAAATKKGAENPCAPMKK
jgi:hypothetical protein